MIHDDPEIKQFYVDHGFRFLPSGRFLIEGHEVNVHPIGYMISKHASTPENALGTLRIYEADFSDTSMTKGKYCYDEERLLTFTRLDEGNHNIE